MNNLDIYLSQIEQLKRILEFYSNENNWNNGIIEKDNGFMAKKTLESLKSLDKTMEEYKNFYDKIVQTNKEDDIIKILKNYNLIE